MTFVLVGLRRSGNFSPRKEHIRNVKDHALQALFPLGVAAPASGVGVQLCPSASGGGAVALGAATAVLAGVGGPPSAFAAVPSVSGRQQTSRPSRRRRRSSSDGTDRRSKKHPRGRSPSPGPSSRRWERPYRSSSESSEDARAEASPPRAGRAPGGTLGDFRPAPAGDHSPCPGPSLLAIFALLRQVTALRVLDLRVGRRGRPGERSVISQVLVVDPPRLQVWRMATGLVRTIRLTLTGMTLSGQFWASSGTTTPWKSLQESHRLNARLLLHRSMG